MQENSETIGFFFCVRRKGFGTENPNCPLAIANKAEGAFETKIALSAAVGTGAVIRQQGLFSRRLPREQRTPQLLGHSPLREGHAS